MYLLNMRLGWPQSRSGRHEEECNRWLLPAAKLGFINIPPRTLNTTRVGTLIVATIYLQLIQNRYMLRSLTVLQSSHQHCVQPVAGDVEVVGYL